MVVFVKALRAWCICNNFFLLCSGSLFCERLPASLIRFILRSYLPPTSPLFIDFKASFTSTTVTLVASKFSETFSRHHLPAQPGYCRFDQEFFRCALTTYKLQDSSYCIGNHTTNTHLATKHSQEHDVIHPPK